jgi:hypothetical protein
MLGLSRHGEPKPPSLQDFDRFRRDLASESIVRSNVSIESPELVSIGRLARDRASLDCPRGILSVPFCRVDLARVGWPRVSRLWKRIAQILPLE